MKKRLHKHLHKFESTLWLVIKLVFYFALLATFILVQRQENIGLRRLSRTMGITVLTFVVVGLLLLTVYGAYDVGRRKSKPIIYSMTLAVICTDVVTYLQVMIMRANTNVHEFQLRGVQLLFVTFFFQLLIIIIFVYGGNALFFLIHEPERCCVITSCQESLDVIAYVDRLDLKRYMGLWYEIARYDHRFERGLTEVTATYILRPDGTIRVENRGCKRNSPYDICRTATGHAKIPDPAQPGKLKVSFFLNFYSDYYVMELDQENYNYALIGSSTDKYLWILSRTPQLPEDIKKKLVTAAERRGYDTNRLQWIEQL